MAVLTPLTDLIPQERFASWSVLAPRNLYFFYDVVVVEFYEDALNVPIQPLRLVLSFACIECNGDILGVEMTLQTVIAKHRNRWLFRSFNTALWASGDLFWKNYPDCSEPSSDPCIDNAPGKIRVTDLSSQIDQWLAQSENIFGMKTDLFIFSTEFLGCDIFPDPCGSGPGWYTIVLYNGDQLLPALLISPVLCVPSEADLGQQILDQSSTAIISYIGGYIPELLTLAYGFSPVVGSFASIFFAFLESELDLQIIFCPDPECGTGGQCPDGQEFDETTQACENICPPGQYRFYNDGVYCSPLYTSYYVSLEVVCGKRSNLGVKTIDTFNAITNQVDCSREELGLELSNYDSVRNTSYSLGTITVSSDGTDSLSLQLSPYISRFSRVVTTPTFGYDPYTEYSRFDPTWPLNRTYCIGTLVPAQILTVGYVGIPDFSTPLTSHTISGFGYSDLYPGYQVINYEQDNSYYCRFTLVIRDHDDHVIYRQDFIDDGDNGIPTPPSESGTCLYEVSVILSLSLTLDIPFIRGEEEVILRQTVELFSVEAGSYQFTAPNVPNPVLNVGASIVNNSIDIVIDTVLDAAITAVFSPVVAAAFSLLDVDATFGVKKLSCTL